MLLLSGCHHGQVHLQVSPDSNSHEWRKIILPDQFSAPCHKLLYDVKPPVGYAEARYHAPEGVTLNIRMRWNGIVWSLCDRLNELRLGHNEARITIREFDERYAKLFAAVKDLTDKKAALDGARGDRGRAHGLPPGSSARGGDAVDSTTRSRPRRSVTRAAAASLTFETPRAGPRGSGSSTSG